MKVNRMVQSVGKELPLRNVLDIWQSCEAVCFDVDSTVCTGEAIDDLATFCGVGDEVSEITRKAMGEGLSFRDALHKRLSIINPSRENIKEFLEARPQKLTAGIEELITTLRDKKVEVFLISGGFRRIIEPVAQQLAIPKESIFANRILFADNGSYESFDLNEPTSTSGGKKIVVQNLKTEKKYGNLVMIGDGMTDLEAFPPADLFIGFGGNRIRENVQKLSPWYVTDFKDLIEALKAQ